MTDFLFDRSVILEFEDRVTGEKFQITDNKIDFQVEKQISTEPNPAFVDIYNLSDETSERIKFRKEILQARFGKTIKIIAGYRGREKKIFQGVIIGANILRETVDRIMRIEARNLWFILQGKRVKKTASKGELKADFIIKLITDDIGGNLPFESRKYIKETLGNKTFKDTTTFFGTAVQVVDKISNNLLSKVIIAFDDAGVTFQPIGIPLGIEPLEYSSKLRTGLIGTPEPTETGLDFKVALDNELRINRMVIVDSDTVRALEDGGLYIVKKVVHAGVNRSDGVWESRVETVFNLNPKGDFDFAFA